MRDVYDVWVALEGLPGYLVACGRKVPFGRVQRVDARGFSDGFVMYSWADVSAIVVGEDD